jgi:hypothetical protein
MTSRSSAAGKSRIDYRRLADAIDLQLQLKQAHWSVKGPHFIGLHELFDKIAEEVETYVDRDRRARCPIWRHCPGHRACGRRPLEGRRRCVYLNNVTLF